MMDTEKGVKKHFFCCERAVTRTTPVFMDVSEILSILIFFSGCAVLLGWALDIPTLKSVLPDFVTMKANTALAFVFSGLSLWTLQIKRRDDLFYQRLAQVFSGAVLTIGLLTLLEYLFHKDLGIDQFLFKELPGALFTSSPGRMAFNAAINFTIIGLALSLLASKTKDRCLAAQILMMPAGGISALALIGYLYQVPPLFLGAYFSAPMALNTTLLFLLVFFGTLFCRPGCGIMSSVSSDTLGGKMIRRLFPVIILVPLALGSIELYGKRFWAIGGEFADALVSTLSLIITTSYVVFLSFWLNKIDTERKRADEMARRADERYRDLVEGTDDLITVVDRQGRFTFVNHSSEKIFGLKPGDCIGRLAFDFIHPDDRENTKKTFEGWVRNKKKQVVYQNRQVHKGGRVFDMLWNISLHFDDSGEVAQISNFARDITEITRAEEKLRLSEQQLRSYIDHAGDAIYVIDRMSGKILNCNNQACKDLGYSKRELLELSVSDIEVQHGHDGIDEIHHQVDSGKTVLIEGVHKRKNGSTYPVEIRLSPLGSAKLDYFLAIARDITKRRQTEKLLQENEAKLLEAQRMAQLGYWVWDVKTGNVEWSEEVFKIFCLDPKKFTLHIDSIMAFSPWPGDRERDKELIREVTKTRQIGTYEQRFLRPDQSIGYYQSTFQGRYDERGDLVSIVGTVMDITERKKGEEEIKELNLELEERVRQRTAELAAVVKELEAFGYSVAHDLKAPLRAMTGFANILSEDYAPKLDENGRRVISVINDNAKTMGQMIDDLLKLSHLGKHAMNFVDIDVTALVRSIESELRQGLSRDRNVDVAVKSLPAVRADLVLVRQIFTNLILNAIKFTGRKEKAVIEIGGYDKDGEYVYYVKDNGTGFDMKYKDKLFGIFQRIHAQDEFQGFGIGLAIVKNAVLRHGGKVWAEGEVDQGATFYFTLPKGVQHD
jgi:PAS domain S-box-containing protein